MPTSRKASSKSRGKRKEVTADDALPTTAKRKKRKALNETVPPSESTSADVVDVDMHDLSANDTEEQLQTGADFLDPAQIDTRTLIDLEMDSEEEKPKPVLNLTYQGFNIYGHCLCVVVEPWPVIRSTTTTPLSISKRKAESARVQQQASRPRLPPFLSEDLEEDEERTSTIEISDGDSDSDETGGMMEFSQVLRSIGDSRAGAANDDEDMDGSVLFGDADEFRELQ
jgi:hypothetical protein